MKTLKALMVTAALLGGIPFASAVGTPKGDAYGDPLSLKGDSRESTVSKTVPNKSQETCMKEGRTGPDLDVCTKTPQEPAQPGNMGSQKSDGSANLNTGK